jgi:hypothetical protein
MSPSGSSNLKNVQRRCEAQLRALELPGQIELSTLLARIAALRSRPIAVWPLARRPGACGLWVATPLRDYVFYESDTSPLHQAHIILHELGHVIWGHRSADVLDHRVLQALLPDIDPGVLETVLRRARYETIEEQEAEMLASLVLPRLAPESPAHTPIADDERTVLARLGRSLEAHDEGVQ